MGSICEQKTPIHLGRITSSWTRESAGGLAASASASIGQARSGMDATLKGPGGKDHNVRLSGSEKGGIAMRIDWLGHDGFRIVAEGHVLYFDPYEIEGGYRADLILVSHDHYDHCSPEDIAKVLKEETVILAPAHCKAPVSIRPIEAGEKTIVQGVEVEAVPAYNTDKQFHPKSQGGLGYVVTLEGKRIYHAGDTDLIPEMDHIDCDIALLPVSGTYVMTAEEAAEAARRIAPELAIPMHYGSGVVGSVKDAQRFMDLLKDSDIQVELKKRCS